MIIRLLAFIAAMCFASVAEAQNVWWSTPASACTPSDETIKFDRYMLGIAKVQHATGNVDPIVLNCPISGRFNVGTTSWHLKLTYQDSTGIGMGACAHARLYQMVIGTSAPVLLATANSNSSAVKSLNSVTSPTFTHTFDFTTNIYWVRVEMGRTVDTQTVIVHAVVLEGA